MPKRARLHKGAKIIHGHPDQQFTFQLFPPFIGNSRRKVTTQFKETPFSVPWLSVNYMSGIVVPFPWLCRVTGTL